MDYPDAVIAKAKRTATLIERVESGESLAKVCTELGLSVSWEQLKKLQAKYETGGREWQALLDGRFGHDVKVHSALKEWLYERKRQDSSLRASHLAKEIAEKFDVELSAGHINHLLRKRGLTAPPGRPFKETEVTEVQETREEATPSQENAGLFFPGGSEASAGGQRDD
jgi:transposase